MSLRSMAGEWVRHKRSNPQREKLCSDVSDGIVSNGRHGTLWAAERMANTK